MVVLFVMILCELFEMCYLWCELIWMDNVCVIVVFGCELVMLFDMVVEVMLVGFGCFG